MGFPVDNYTYPYNKGLDFFLLLSYNGILKKLEVTWKI